MEEICIVGSGYMALEHLKAALELDYAKIYVVGRTRSSFVKYFTEVNTNPTIVLLTGGLDEWFRSAYFNASMIHINAVAIEALKQTTEKLLEHNVKRILLEKPGALTIDELVELRTIVECSGSIVLIGYNRRHYASVRKLKELLSKEAITSFEFEFTEWVDSIDPNDYSDEALENWIKSNSAHVIDTAFYLAGGFPTELITFSSGIDKVEWHPRASIFVGSGMFGNIPFTYNSDWTSQGRWRIYIRTASGKYILEPMEKLGFIPRNSIHKTEIEIDEELSKPGLAQQLRSFEKAEYSEFCSLDDQINLFSIIDEIIA